MSGTRNEAFLKFELTDLLWLGWLAAAGFVTWPAMWWELGYLRKTCPNFFNPFVAVMAASPVLFLGWHWVRRRFLSRHEFAIFSSLVLAICAAYEQRATLVTMLVFATAFCAGRRLTRVLTIATAGPLEDIAVSVAMGLGALHIGLFAIGLAHAYVGPVFLALIAMPLLLWRRELRALYDAFTQIDTAWAKVTEQRPWAGSLLSASLLVLALTVTTYALVPSTYFDFLNLHLPAARYYVSQHALVFPPSLIYAYYPQSVETFMALGYALAGQPAAQLLPQIYFIVSMLLLIRIARVSGISRFSAVAGVAFSASIPVLHWTAGSAKNDFALVMFLFGALLAFLRWRDTQRWGWILAGALFIAMGAGVKHIMLFAIPPLLAFYFYAAWRRARTVWACAQIGAIMLVFGLFWHVRTWIATGNPIYPSSPVTAVQNQRPDRQPEAFRARVWRYVRFPWDLHFQGKKYYESESEYPMGILLPVFVPLWWRIWKRLNAASVITLSFSGAYLAYWALSVGMIRYAIAPIALVFAFTACRVLQFASAGSRLRTFSVFIACCYALLFSFCAIAINEINRLQLRYFAKEVDTREYLREALQPYRALEFVSTAAKPGDEVLCVDSCAAAYVPPTSRYTCYLVDPQSPWEGARTLLSRGRYRFAVIPRIYASDAPAGWTPKYVDVHFTVLVR